MKRNRNIFVVITLCLVAVATLFMMLANKIQTDSGNIELIDGQIADERGQLTFKLYKPLEASAQNKAPAVLLLHGYQNDHETCAAYAIELARRGAVVLCLDEYGHGATSIGLAQRGYVNHVVKVNYGNDSEEDGTFKKIGGSIRYRVLMNFSNLSFFNDRYSKDSDGNRILDSSCGGSIAYGYLAGLDYVDSSRMAVSGHSMGTWSSWSVAADYSNTPIEPKAIVLQCGELFTDDVYDSSIRFNNVLLLQAKYDEFSYFRDYQRVVDDDLLKSDLRTSFLNTTADKAQWNKTYGNFADGSARRMELLITNHRLTTHNVHGLQVALDWFDQAIGLPKNIGSSIIAKNKEYLVLASMMLVLGSLFPLMAYLLELDLFADVRQDLPSKESMPGKSGFKKGALITILISGATFPFMTQLGHALLPLPEKIFRMTVGNGFLGWYLLLIIVMLITSFISRKQNQKKGIETEKFDLRVFLKSLLLACVMIVYMYIINLLYYRIFDLDLRFIWPFFREFTFERFGQFLVYLPVFGLFYYLNNTKIMRDLRTQATYEKGLSGFLKNWLINFALMAGGVLLVVLIEYIPFFANIGPGADVLFGSTFGGPFMSILILFVPQVMFFSILCTYAYRSTGRAYTGAMLAAMLACWIVTGGSSIL